MGLAMQQGLKLELVSYTDHISPIFGLCEDIKINIEGLKSKYSNFVVEYEDHDLILGQLFLNSVNFS